ncbi:hypothetical protein NE237_011098 [Protea cynaroides]|uniref:Uncharacterized protein n=1 Tax=Protea cynaroides TaxID=273540 RepID=A0A9Q0GVI7_9MAGN|nr:hypothetical protein NE237_011098 [Protea cynaroides]
MAPALLQASSFRFSFALLAFFSLSNYCSCFNPRLYNFTESKDASSWSVAGATWYGSPNGYGTDGGACGYGSVVGTAPFYSMVSAGGPSLYKSGEGCGTCFEVKCTSNAACSGNPVTVTIIDECPGCVSESFHFDLSGLAFGAMAENSQADQLRNAGQLEVQFRRVECNYQGYRVNFRVDPGSNNNYFAVAIEFENRDGDLSEVYLQQAQNPNEWLPMQRSWGAVWKLDSGGTALRGPFTLSLKSLQSGETLVAQNVIPAEWQPGATYSSDVNF